MTSNRPNVALIVGPTALANRFETSRVHSLWRGLCQCAETWRLDVVPDADPGDSGKRYASAGPKSFKSEFYTLLEESDAQTIILAGNPDVNDDLMGSGLRVISVPDGTGHVPECATEIWARHPDQIDPGLIGSRTVEIIPDAFEPVSDHDARSPRPNRIAVIGDPDALPDKALEEITADFSEFVVAPEFRSALAQRGVGPLVFVDTVGEALEKAGSCAILGSESHAAPILTWSILNDCNVVWPTDVDTDGDDLTCFDPLVTLKAITEALQVDMPDDETETGALVARNLECDITLIRAMYHPSVRLFDAIYECKGHVPSGCMSGQFRLEKGDTQGLVNAWLTELVPNPIYDGLRLRASAALADNVELDDIIVDLVAWGWPVASFKVPEELEVQVAGLISMSPSADRTSADVVYWGQSPETRVQLGRKLIEQEPVMRGEDGTSIFRTTGTYPFNRDSLTVLPPNDFGQKFTRFYLFDERNRSSARLEAMRDKYKGRVGWLVGNGPSVRLEDLDMLADAGCLCFGFNRFYLAHENTKLRPQFTVTADLQMIEDFGQEVVDSSGGTVFVAHDEAPNLVGDYLWVRQISVSPSLFSTNAADVVTPGGSSVYVALQIGYYLGIRKWYMYGADFSFSFSPPRHGSSAFRSATGDGNHFISNYRSGRAWCPPSIENILPSFYNARLAMEMDGGFIRNATRGGNLHVFDRVDFEVALSETNSQESAREPSLQYPDAVK